MIPRLAFLPIAASCLIVPALAQTNGALRPPAALIHGNYCGMGNNAPLLPVDALDLACARHDACTPSGGLPSRACNMRLQREADVISRDPRQPDDLRALAGFISAGAAMLPFDAGSPVVVTRLPLPAPFEVPPGIRYRPASSAY
ncbi:hypothetical protein J2X36_000899 [Methylobacterium sp. BE186]|uniref:hypothetical protein n=1 Tax=Methylobacterium sp. BE186 TaxID=2817715 RepID=UPI00285A5E0A|nr:hypothetical protein [Methylobacterium sp. BE186]MDR7036161.1 hypothetical protein [Methylobacterium sp. BE186]